MTTESFKPKPVLGAGRAVKAMAAAPIPVAPAAPVGRTEAVAPGAATRKVLPGTPANLPAPVTGNQREVAEKILTLAGVTFVEGLPGHETSAQKQEYVFSKLQSGQVVTLVADPFGSVVKPDEGHPDPDAVSAQAVHPEDGLRHIGYLPKAKAKAKLVSNILKQFPDVVVLASIQAIKGGFYSEDGEWINYGIDIVVQFSEA